MSIEFKYRKFLQCYVKKKNTDILQGLNTAKNWIINSVIPQKEKYFGHAKCHNSSESELLWPC